MAEIQIAGAVGHGPTDKAAFDDALDQLGIAHCNLITLSSVVPEDAGPVISIPAGGKIAVPGAGWGDRLYCVLAEASSSRGQDIGSADGVVAAGIGWCRHPSGRGVFVEHGAYAVDPGLARRRVEQAVTLSIDSMMRRREWHPKEVERDFLIAAGSIGLAPYTCALVVAAIEHAPWSGMED